MFKLLAPQTTDDFWPHAEPSFSTDCVQGSPSIRHRATARFRAGMTAIATRRALRQAALELQALNDRMLKDIGVNRSEIGYLVRYGRVR